MTISTSLFIAQGHVPLQFAPAQLQRPSSFWTGEGFVPADIAVDAGHISALGQPASSSTAPQLDASDCVVLPGFIDVHVHGAVGRDTMDASAQALDDMARFYATHGVTGFLPTTMTASLEATTAAVRAVASHTPLPPSGARIMGIHLEGPYISPHFPGAQLADAIRPPALDEFRELIAAGPVRMVTLAPELPGAHPLIHAARAQGITVATGHTAATYDECEQGFGVGVSQATHTYNAMTGLHHRRPGTLGAVLTNDDIYAQLIADNIHVHPVAMKILVRCKGVSHTILITDAIRAAGLEAGQYELGGQMVTVREGAVPARGRHTGRQRPHAGMRPCQLPCCIGPITGRGLAHN